MHTTPEKKILMLRPDEICPSANQMRKTFDEYALKNLSESIAANGVVQPVCVRRNKNGTFELISGEKRLRAAVAAGLRRIPCIVYRVDDETAAVYAMCENLQRSDVSFFEEAQAIGKMMSRYGLSVSELADKLGTAESEIVKKMRLLRLSDALRNRISEAGLTERHARALLKIPDENRERALDKIISEGLTVKQTEEYIYGLLNFVYPEQKEAPVRKQAIGDIRIFANSLNKLVEMLTNSGMDAHSKRYENEKYVEYRVRINKENAENHDCKQLKIC